MLRTTIICHVANTRKRQTEYEENLAVKRNKLQINVKMFCWGSAGHGELGLGGIEEENIFVPREVDFEKCHEIQQITCGDNYTIVITKDGQIYSCGNNDYGQLGHEKGRKRLQLIPDLEAFAFRKIACGNSHTLAVNEWGQLFSWGSNTEGQLGLNTTDVMQRTPRLVRTLGINVIVQIACGLKHTVALTNNGELYAWGSNNEGQLGLGRSTQMETKPKLLHSLTAVPIAFIACGGYHTIAISKSGVVFAWGRNTFGQLGLNDTKNRNLPCQLPTLRNAKVCYAACGEEFSVFLTLDGGVFTCGAGMYGQLGHGNNMNEILPRQVMELMGSTVIQISCGRKHTLALVSSGGKVYSWGLGGVGQLGNHNAQSAKAPQIVLGPWKSFNESSKATSGSQPDHHITDCVIKHIYSGGDHCFAITNPINDNAEPDDCRILDTTSQILTVTEEQLATCQRIAIGAPVDHELMMYLETVFKSQACINGSFLLDNDSHYGCSNKHHGVDIDRAIRLFGIISELDNKTIQELIFTCITENLIPSFENSPLDVETLRVYLTLPLYHGFTNPLNFSTLQNPFSKAMFGLKIEARNVVTSWWHTAPTYYFEKLVRIYKSIILHFVKQAEDKSIRWNVTIQYALDMLVLLHQLNYTSHGKMRLCYGTFQLPELTTYIDIRYDFLRWISDKQSSFPEKMCFCYYPFLFDTQAKTILLETDQSLQMQTAVNAATSQAIRQILFNPHLSRTIPLTIQYITLNVSREGIVRDTLTQLSAYNSSDLKKPLRVKFHGEEAEDAGGVKKEFFMLLLREILDPKYGMFKEYEETRTIWFNEDSLEDVSMYFLIGLLCGLAIYNFIIINLPFPLALYKKLLRESVGLNDLEDISPIIFKSMRDILDYNELDFEEVFNLHFEIARISFGEQKTFELISDGGQIPVTLENRQQFVDLYVDYMLNKSVEAHFQAFYNGFHKVCGGRVLELLESHELMAVIIGNEDYDWQELEKNTIYKEGYSRSDPTIVLFWQVFHELPLQEKRKFLLFLTGSDRIPIQGMNAIQITIQPMKDERLLPVAHTCFNFLDLPRYKTRERLKYKLLQAIQQTEGFSLV